MQTKGSQLLQFNVAQLLKHGGGGIPRIHKIKNVLLPNLNQDFTLLAPLNGAIKLTKANNDILVTGSLDTIMELTCTRCLMPVNKAITVEIEETFSPSHNVSTGAKIDYTSGIDTATLINEQHILDLSEVIRQVLYLYQPGKILCKDTCQGLCDQCGQNKNEGTCSCIDNKIDTRWAKLLALKNDI